MTQELAKPSANLVKRDAHGRILPGQVSLNPLGKPVGTRNIDSELNDLLETLVKTEDGTELKKTYKQLLHEKVISLAIKKGSEQMIKMIYDRIGGQAKQGIDLTTNGQSITASSDINVQELADKVAENLKVIKTTKAI